MNITVNLGNLFRLVDEQEKEIAALKRTIQAQGDQIDELKAELTVERAKAGTTNAC